jgi:ABC-2 type transport system ATP-binding protein
MRDFLRAFASQGRTVFVSSHLLSEMEVLADDVIIIAAGRLVANGRLQDVLSRSQGGVVRVRTPHVEALAAELQREGATVRLAADGSLQVPGVEPGFVGRAALAAQAELHELVLDKPDLEQVFLELTQAKAGIR